MAAIANDDSLTSQAKTLTINYVLPLILKNAEKAINIEEIVIVETIYPTTLETPVHEMMAIQNSSFVGNLLLSNQLNSNDLVEQYNKVNKTNFFEFTTLLSDKLNYYLHSLFKKKAEKQSENLPPNDSAQEKCEK
jgi:TPP-dependent indolepyruvate ferredoxin oxidoreductase alpha subunit